MENQNYGKWAEGLTVVNASNGVRYQITRWPDAGQESVLLECQDLMLSQDNRGRKLRKDLVNRWPLTLAVYKRVRR